jgi:hypothetical protein
MKRIKWTLEESVVLVDAYARNGYKIPLPANEISHISELLNRRANILGLDIDEKFRNKSGLNMQSACIHYVFTEGAEGLSNSNDMFYKAHNLFIHDKAKFDEILESFYTRYSS